MTDVKTQPVRATWVPYADFFDEEMQAKVPGSFCIAPEDHQETDKPWTRWFYGCPCGCGASGGLRIGTPDKPAESPSWGWNGSWIYPVLTPSVNHVGHWHGWLGGSGGERPGWWISC